MGLLDIFKKKPKQVPHTYVYPPGSYTVTSNTVYPQPRYLSQQPAPQSFMQQNVVLPDSNFGPRTVVTQNERFHGSDYNVHGRQRRDSNSSAHSVQSFHSQGHNRHYDHPRPNYRTQQSYGSVHSLVHPTAPPEPYQIIVQNTNDFLKSHPAVSDSTGSLHNPQDYNDHQQRMYHHHGQSQSYRADMAPHDIGQQTSSTVSYQNNQTPDHLLRGPVIYDSGYVRT